MAKSDRGASPPALTVRRVLVWSADRNCIYFVAADKARQSLSRIHVQSGTAERLLSDGRRAASEHQQDGQLLAFIQPALPIPPERASSRDSAMD